MPRKAARRKRREQAPKQTLGKLGYPILIVLVLATFASLLGNTELWPEYDQAIRSPYTSMEGIGEALSLEMLHSRQLFDSLSYFVESKSSLPVAQVHRSINILLHLLSALLLLRLLRTLELPGAFAASLAFALHPAVVQPLFWAGARNELFGLVVILAALNCGVRSRNGIEYLLALLLTFLACLIHQAGLFIPVILALIIYLQKRRFHLNEYNRVLPIACLALFTCVWLQGISPAIASDSLSTHQAISHASQNLFFFYEQAFAPSSPALFYTYDSKSVELMSLEFSLLPFCIFLPLYALALFKFRTVWSRGLILGLTAFIILLLPGINTHGINIDGSPAHETYGLYIALPAVLALMIAGSRSLIEKIEIGGKSLWMIALSLLIIIEIMITGAFAYELGNPVRMWQLQAEQWPNQWAPKAALINYAENTDELELSQLELIRTLEQLLEEKPDLLNERRILARSYMAANEKTNALREYRRILRESEPDDEFLQEAADYLQVMGMNWEADNARKRMQATPTP